MKKQKPSKLEKKVAKQVTAIERISGCNVDRTGSSIRRNISYSGPSTNDQQTYVGYIDRETSVANLVYDGTANNALAINALLFIFGDVNYKEQYSNEAIAKLKVCARKLNDIATKLESSN